MIKHWIINQVQDTLGNAYLEVVFKIRAISFRETATFYLDGKSSLKIMMTNSCDGIKVTSLIIPSYVATRNQSPLSETMYSLHILSGD